jgi:hypothetical protein
MADDVRSFLKNLKKKGFKDYPAKEFSTTEKEGRVIVYWNEHRITSVLLSKNKHGKSYITDVYAQMTRELRNLNDSSRIDGHSS